jgi:hypothetical protein
VPESWTFAVFTPPLFGFTKKVVVTRKFAIKGSPVLPLIVNVYPGGAVPTALDLTVKAHPEAMIPPETEHRTVFGENR